MMSLRFNFLEKERENINKNFLVVIILIVTVLMTNWKKYIIYFQLLLFIIIFGEKIFIFCVSINFIKIKSFT
jgi:hypothetical protein